MKGLLIDYKWCSNCHSCEVACGQEHQIPVGKWGIKVFQNGPWQADDGRWQHDYIPVPTILCDLCEERVSQGKEPACVQHCLSKCMFYGTQEELEAIASSKGEKVLIWYPIKTE